MKKKNKYIILITILFQSTIIVMFNTTILASSSLATLKMSIPFFNIVVVITTILMLISLKKLSYYEKKEAEFELIKSNMNSVEELMNLIQTQKNDYLTHIQSIGALVYIEEYEELSNYLNGISNEYRFTSEFVRLGHPALTALINAKREIARKKNIFFHIRCKQKIDNIVMPSWDLCSLISNLVENAIEAASMIEGKKWIKVTVGYCNNNLLFEIENTGQIQGNIMKDLFKQGNTSRSSAGRGYGLYISKKIVDKYQGVIDIRNTTHGTVVCTITLPREVDDYDKEVS